MATPYIYTNKGWKEKSEILTPKTGNIKKGNKFVPIHENEELTKKFKEELPMVVVRKGNYYILSVI